VADITRAPVSEVPPGVTEARPTEDGSAPPPKRLKFPTALTVLAIILAVVWVASFFIPSGFYQLDPSTGGPIPGTYRELPT
jgi:hypothetical protein